MKRQKKAFALLLAGMVLFTALPVSGQAKENKEPEGICVHHPAHDEDCGYTEGMEGMDCTHEHAETCYVMETNCLHTCSDSCYSTDSLPEKEGEEGTEAVEAGEEDEAFRSSVTCNHICSIENGCMTEVTDCVHEKGEHDEACGYTPAVEGTPCGYICTRCSQDGDGEDNTEPGIQQKNGEDREEESLKPKMKMQRIDPERVYDAGDVTVINDIIRKNKLEAEEDKPETWDFAFWDRGTPRRINSLNLNNRNMEGDLDVMGLTSLESLYCYNNGLTSLDVTGLTSLKTLNCSYNGLMRLDVTGLTGLEILSCYNNGLTSLDVTGLTSLENLTCSDNVLTSLDVTGLTSLEKLICSNNVLTSLDVTGLTSLEVLSCSDNGLTSLDVTGLTSLKTLTCSNNGLTNLNITGLTSMNMMNCAYNQLTSLDLNGLDNLTYIFSTGNPFTSITFNGGYTLTVEQSEGGTVKISNYSLSTNEITLSASPLSGWQFKEWVATDENVIITDNIFTMPGNDVTVKAVFERNGGGEESGSTGGGPAQSGGEAGGTGSSDLSSHNEEDAQDVSEPVKGRMEKGSIRQYVTEQGWQAFTLTLPQNKLKKLVQEEVFRFEADSNWIGIGLCLDTMKELYGLSGGGDILIKGVLTEDPADEGRPAWELSLVSLKDGVETPIALTGNRAISVKLPYALREGERAEGVYGIMETETGEPGFLTWSVYDTGKKAVLFRFSKAGTYGAGYCIRETFINGMESHWARESLLFAMERGLFESTGEKSLTPDTPVTERMLEEALIKLLGITPKTGDHEEKTPVTRQQMAVILKEYTEKADCCLYPVLETAFYRDSNQIGKEAEEAEEAVRSLQKAGVLTGKDGNLFAPKETVTLAEAAGVLKRLAEVTIFPWTAEAWIINDSGTPVYYEKGRPFTGWLNAGEYAFRLKDGVVVELIER